MIVPTRILVALALLGGMAMTWLVYYEHWKTRQGIVRKPSEGDSGGGWLDLWWGGSDSSADGGLDLD